MDLIKVNIKNVKNIINADIELPLEGGVYSIVGGNGCGKSTLMLILSVISSQRRYLMFKRDDFDKSSEISITLDLDNQKNPLTNNWYVNEKGKWACTQKPAIYYPGVYEGSLFYGTRFDDSRVVDDLLREDKIKAEHIIDAQQYVKENLSMILHGDRTHYKKLKRIVSKKVAETLNLKNVPYFIETSRGSIVSQYRMSSGECLLVSLLNYIYFTIVNSRSGAGINKLSPIFIDEIELALHPIAISRLINYLHDLSEKFPKLTVYLTSHSPEVIKTLKPENMFLIKNESGNVSLINPCFPSYAIRDVYRHDGFDFLILAEDLLASYLIDSVLLDKNLKESRLIHISPVGGWQNVLSLHLDLLKNNVMGVNRKIISILDGDIVKSANEATEYKNLPKLFLPIQSIEKFIYSIVFQGKNQSFKKSLNDKYFTIKSLDDLSFEHNQRYDSSAKNQDKLFYFRIKKDLESRNITEVEFIKSLSADIKREIDFSTFEKSLTKMLEQ
ncbi:ATP-dependent nuclease [Providencia stuartii]